MAEYTELPGGRLKEKPKSHIRGQEKSLRKSLRKEEGSFVAEFKERRSEVFRKQDVGGAIDELKHNPAEIEWEKPDIKQTEESQSWVSDLSDSREENNETPEEIVDELRGDLTVRNQPDPGRYRRNESRGRPKHFKG